MSETLRLRPDRSLAARWSVGAVVLLGLAGWLIWDASGDPVMWTFFALAVAASSYFLLQLVLPGSFEVRLDPAGLRARTLWQHVDLGWEDVEDLEIRFLAGEPWLAIDLVELAADGPVIVRQGVLLPLGTDLHALHGWLVAHRGLLRHPPQHLHEPTI